MSIIYDALMKVQKNFNKETTTAKTSPPAQTSRPVHPKIRMKFILVYIVVVCLGLILGNFAYNFFAHPKNIVSPPLPTPIKPEPVAPVVNTETPAAAAASVVSPPSPVPEPTLVLNGVFFEQGDGYALINNKIMRLGDEISHAKVKEITIDGVVLEFEGKTIKLSSPS